MPDPPWNWDADDEERMPLPRMAHHHHHHHHPRRIPSPWSLFPSGGPGDRGMTEERSWLVL